MLWPVMRLCDAQLTDIDPTDVLNDRLYRRCNTYKGGGGYDRFPEIYQNRFGPKDTLNDQFVVQLRGCPLNCTYCYVTREGVWGNDVRNISTDQLVQDFRDSKCEVLHLMGGAPAIYLNYWHEIIEKIPDKIFHSDLMLVEHEYTSSTLRHLSQFSNTLYAISIKGCNEEEFFKNTRTKLDEWRFFHNLDLIIGSGISFYFTFTGMPKNSIKKFKYKVNKRYGNSSLFDDSFAIDIIHYNALNYNFRRCRYES